MRRTERGNMQRYSGKFREYLLLPSHTERSTHLD